MAERTKVCNNCKFYQHLYEPDKAIPSVWTGECRKSAPVGGAGGRGWPLVVLKDWCPMWDREGVMEDVHSEDARSADLGGVVVCTGCAWHHPNDLATKYEAFDTHICADHPAENLPEAERGE